jgi:hypothetical protein
MDMYDIEVAVEEEDYMEKVAFAKALLKRKNKYRRSLDTMIAVLEDELYRVTEEYDEILEFDIEEVYKTYKHEDDNKGIVHSITFTMPEIYSHKFDDYPVCGDM